MPRRLAFFYASVGTGHRVAAEALKEWCLHEYPDSEVLCRDLLDYVPGWIRWSVVNSYLAMARRSPWLWGELYRGTDASSGRRLSGAFWRDVHTSVSRAFLRRLLGDLDRFAPNAIFATHFFGMSSLLDVWDQHVPIYFVDTDFISHSLQRDPRFAGWFVGSDESVRQHRADSIPSTEVTVKNLGIPISMAYASPLAREKTRDRLSVDERTRMVLVSGGGIGAGALGTVADSMLDCTDWRVEIVCGNNKRMFEALRERYYPFKHIIVRRFLGNIRDYYAASDVVVLKPGGLSAAETLAMGCALLLLDPLPGQERYNCDYLLERGAARRVYENRRVGELIKELLESGEELERMRANARAIGRPFAARDILRVVMEELDADRRG